MATYISLSEEIFGGEFVQEYYYQPLYYAFFVPCVYSLFGPSILCVISIQCVISALTIWFAGLCVAMSWNRRAAVICALLLSLSRELIFFTAYYQIETINAFLMTLFLFSLLLAIKMEKASRWIFPGFVCSLVILSRANAIVFIPATIIFMAIVCVKKYAGDKCARHFRNGILCSIVFLFSSLLPILPYSFHNYAMTGRVSGPSTAGFALLALSSNPEAPPAGTYYSETFRSWTSGKKSIMRHFGGWLLANPLEFAELAWRKTLIFWNFREVNDNIDSHKQGSLSLTLDKFKFIPSYFLIIPFFACLIFVPRRIFLREKFILPAILILSYSFILVFFCIVTRYRIGILPLIAIYCGISGDIAISIFQKGKGNMGLRSWKFILSFLLSSAFVFGAYDFYRYKIEKIAMQVIKPRGDIIELDSGKMFFDSGCFWFGSWRMFNLQKGDVIIKKFSTPEKTGNCQLLLRVKFAKPGQLVLKINGSPIIIHEEPASSKDLDLSFNLPSLDSGIVNITVEDIDTEVWLFADFQRDYGRTVVNGEKIDAELVSRIICK